MRETNLLDINYDEAKKITALQEKITRKYNGANKDIKTWAKLREELTYGMNELGFEVDVHLHPDYKDVWVPCCDIIGRTNKSLQELLNTEGRDVERKIYDASHRNSAQLEAEGIDPTLMM